MPIERPREYKEMPAFVTKIDAEQGIVEAIVSTMGVRDHGRDIIVNGAYAKTIAERGRQVHVLNAHNSWRIEDVIGMPLALREVGRDELPAELLAMHPSATGGLWTQTKYLLNTPEGLGAFERIKVGAIQQYSIGYEAIQFEIVKEADGTHTRYLKEVKLWEYSPVLWGMNPATMTTSVKADLEVMNQLLLKVGRTLSRTNEKAIVAAVQQLTEAQQTLVAVLENAGITIDPEEVDTPVNVEDEDSAKRDDPALSAEPPTALTETAPAEAKPSLELAKRKLALMIEIGLGMEA